MSVLVNARRLVLRMFLFSPPRLSGQSPRRHGEEGLVPARRPFEIGRCLCGASVRVDSFREYAMYREFERSGFCQDCLDATLVAGAGRQSQRVALGRGAVVVARDRPSEAAFIPFVYAVSGRFAGWDARAVCHIGPDRDRTDPWDDLGPMRGSLDGHHVCVHHGSRVGDPEVSERVGPVDLVLGVDSVSAQALASVVPLSGDAVRIALTEAFDWSGTYGRPLEPLDSFARHTAMEPTCRSPWAVASALRRCAWLGAALSLTVPGPEPARSTVMDWLLRRHIPGFAGRP